MFKSNTLFVLGAGASREAEMPLGSGLTAKIANFLQFKFAYGRPENIDEALYRALKMLQGRPEWEKNQFYYSSQHVAEAMQLALSIDTFLESHKSNTEFVQLGKLGIARAIAQEERECLMKPNGAKPFHLNGLAATWYYSLARQLFTGIPADRPELAFSSVSFVDFNYDRCLPVFLIRALEVYFRISRPQAESIVSKVRICHPYGSLGSVFEGAHDRLPFAAQDLDLVAIASRLKTFSESCDTTDTIKEWALDAETVIFLGFGFHEQNVSLFEVAQELNEHRPPKRVFATTHGLSDSDEEIVQYQLQNALYYPGVAAYALGHIKVNNGTCHDLFSTYWRSLTN